MDSRWTFAKASNCWKPSSSSLQNDSCGPPHLESTSLKKPPRREGGREYCGESGWLRQQYGAIKAGAEARRIIVLKVHLAIGWIRAGRLQRRPTVGSHRRRAFKTIAAAHHTLNQHLE